MRAHRPKITVEPLATRHVLKAFEFCRSAGWNQTTADWRRLIEYEPAGCFAAFHQSRLVGTVTTTRYGRDLAWIGMMLVDPAYRRQGIATTLMRRALAVLTMDGVQCIKLDATPLGKPVYEQLGFVEEWRYWRWTRTGKAHGASSLRILESLESLSPSLLQLDRQAFGADRSEYLARLARISIVSRRDGGMGMLRSGFLADYLGPVVAPSPETADRIVIDLLTETERTIFWDIPSPNAQAENLAIAMAFRPDRELTRMAYGNCQRTARLQWQFAIGDPSTG